jgi:NADH-quinone oxidoreductase subunit G
MPEILLDGKKIQAESGKTIIEAAYNNGMQIPHFCWHPELSVAGNCRMCLVEVGMPRRNPDGTFETNEDGSAKIGYFPKLQIACSTPVAEGMVVHSKNEKAVEAQEAVMEFLLINHPLDCPICDEAGECKLQEYAFQHSKGESRFTETKNHKDKRQSWGSNVMFDAERCISCSRCIRYAKEVAKQDVLTFVQRGDHVTIKLFDDTRFDNPYSMNVIEICPVGALTSPDFRFKSRVWDMSFNESISPADATGSNIKIGIRNNEILRIQPATNMYVNRYWISDDTRLNHYKFVNENRVTEPMARINGELKKVSWPEVYDAAAEGLKKYKPDEIMVLGSGKATTECNYILNKFARNVLKTKNVDFLPHIDKSFEDDFLGVADRLPNANGARETGVIAKDLSQKAEDLAVNIRNGNIKAVYVMEEDFSYHPDILKALKDAEFVVMHCYNHGPLTEVADVVIAAGVYAEIEGTYINKDKRVQHFRPALITTENRRYMGMKMSRLDKFGAINDRWTQHEERNVRQSWRALMGIANQMGAGWKYSKSEDVFDEIVHNIPAFKHMSYDRLDEYQGLVLGRGDRPDKKLNNYDSHVMKPD